MTMTRFDSLYPENELRLIFQSNLAWNKQTKRYFATFLPVSTRTKLTCDIHTGNTKKKVERRKDVRASLGIMPVQLMTALKPMGPLQYYRIVGFKQGP